MPVTVGDLVQRIRTDIGDQGNIYTKDNFLIDWINEAVRDIFRDTSLGRFNEKYFPIGKFQGRPQTLAWFDDFSSYTPGGALGIEASGIWIGTDKVDIDLYETAVISTGAGSFASRKVTTPYHSFSVDITREVTGSSDVYIFCGANLAPPNLRPVTGLFLFVTGSNSGGEFTVELRHLVGGVFTTLETSTGVPISTTGTLYLEIHGREVYAKVDNDLIFQHQITEEQSKVLDLGVGFGSEQSADFPLFDNAAAYKTEPMFDVYIDEITFPREVMQIHSVHNGVSILEEVQYDTILQQQGPAWIRQTGESPLYYWRIYDRGVTKIKFTPPPVGSNGLYISYTYTPEQFTTLSQYLRDILPEFYSDDIVRFAVMRAHERNKDFRASEKAQEHYAYSVYDRVDKSRVLDDSFQVITPDEYDYL